MAKEIKRKVLEMKGRRYRSAIEHSDSDGPAGERAGKDLHRDVVPGPRCVPAQTARAVMAADGAVPGVVVECLAISPRARCGAQEPITIRSDAGAIKLRTQ